MHNESSTRRSASVLTVVENRRWKAIYEHHRLATLEDGFEYVTIGRSYPGVVTPSNKGDFKVNTRPVDGAGWNDHFWPLNTVCTATEPMQDRTRYDLRFRITPPDDSDEPEPMTLASRVLHDLSLLFTIRIGFIGESPVSIWKFKGVDPFARPQTPMNTTAWNLTPAARRHSPCATFTEACSRASPGAGTPNRVGEVFSKTANHEI